MKKERYRKLKTCVIACKIAYYNQATSFISDALYDELEDVVMKIEKEHPDWIIGKPLSEMVGIHPGLYVEKLYHNVKKLLKEK